MPVAKRATCGWHCFAGYMCPYGCEDRAVFGAQCVRLLEADAGGDGSKPGLSPCSFSRSASCSLSPRLCPGLGPQQCCPTLPSSRVPLLYIQPVLAVSMTWLSALCQPLGSNSYSILRTNWAPHSQCSEPDTKPSAGSGHPRV